MHMASLKAEEAKANEYQYKPKIDSSKIAKSYNMMRRFTNGPMLNEDMPAGTDGLRYYSGSSSSEDKAAAEKQRKSFELMKLLTGYR